jgi:hypothetical protein
MAGGSGLFITEILTGLCPLSLRERVGERGFNQTAVYLLKNRMDITLYFMVSEPYKNSLIYSLSLALSRRERGRFE